MDAAIDTLGLPALFASAFLSATLLPGNSEIVLVALLQHAPALMWPALTVTTLGNTYDGLTSYALGRLVPRPPTGRALRWLETFGTPALLLSWLPVIGDALCLASGWLRQNVLLAATFIAVGKFGRYWALATGVTWALR